MGSELARARERMAAARRLIGRLELLDRWRACGVPRIAGAVGADLIVNRDIDLWVVAGAEPSVPAAMGVLSIYAQVPGVRQVMLRNDLDGRNVHGRALCARVTYFDEASGWESWQVEVKVYPSSAAPVGNGVLDRLAPLLDEQRRGRLLRLKEWLLDETVWPPKPRVPSVRVYEAFLEDPDKEWSPDEFIVWNERSMA